jgi:4-alpha-glucanotransferase
MNRRRLSTPRAGLSVPLFSLRSTRSWGIGEIGDLQAVAEWLRLAHLSVLQILPLNELAPDELSPYSPLSSMAIDPQFISIRLLDEAPTFEEVWRPEIEEAVRSPRIDYRRVRRLKQRALRASFDRFFHSEWLLETARADALRAFVAAERWWLGDYSLYRAIRERQGEKPWPEWPPELRDRDASALARAETALAQGILYYQYVQWIAANQWQTTRRAIDGLEVLGDFPFMVAVDSADVWSRQHEFNLDAEIGTPPDAFSEVGQRWGLPPYRWDEARNSDFAWLRMRARRMAELYDGFRIDHLVGFYRTYVCPGDGSEPYFSPASERDQIALGETTMGIVIATGADVTAEDLGVVPAFVRESIARLGLPGYRVLRWEPGDPAAYPANSVALTGTHDTEPLAVWWESLPAEHRRLLGAMPTLRAAHPDGSRGFESDAFDAGIRDAILQAMYGAGSNLVLLPVQDVFGWRDRVNQPATTGAMNWTFALPWPVDRMAGEADAQERARRLSEWGDRSGRWSPMLEASD